MIKRTLAIILCLSMPAFTFAQPFQSDYAKLVTKGVEAYESGEYESAKTAFKDALLLRPEGIEAQKNLALALSKLEEEIEAEEEYNRLINQDIDQQKKAEGYYNLSRLFLQKAQKEMESEEPDVKAIIKNASESIRNANRTLELESDNEQALNNKSQAQHILKQIAIAPPPQQQQQQQQQGEGEDEENEDQQDQQNSDQQNSDQQQNQDQQQQNQQGQNQQNQNSQDQSQDQQQQNQESENSDNEDQEEQDQEESEQNENEEESDQSEEEQQQNQGQQSESDGSQQGRTGQAEPVELTKEQAESLLETLGETKRFVLSSPRYNPDLHNSKEW